MRFLPWTGWDQHLAAGPRGSGMGSIWWYHVGIYRCPPLSGAALGVSRTEFLGWQICPASALWGEASTGLPTQDPIIVYHILLSSASKESTDLGLAVVGVRESCFFAGPLVLAASRALALVPPVLTGRL